MRRLLNVSPYMRISAPLLLSLFCFAFVSAAFGASCATPSMLKPYMNTAATCICGNKIPGLNFPRDTSKTFPLATICGYWKQKDWDYGMFYFSGVSSVSGKIVYQKSDTFEEHFSFRPDQQSKKLLPNDINWLSFSNNQEAHALLKTPRLTHKNNCWSATVTIRIAGIVYEIDEGTDAKLPEMTVLRDVIQAGKFNSCKFESGL